MNAVEFLEVVVSSVENVVSTAFDGDFLHHFGVVDRCRGDVEEGRDLGLQVVLGMNFDSTLVLAELSPPKHFEA